MNRTRVETEQSSSWIAEAWSLALAASRYTERMVQADRPAAYALDENGDLRRLPRGHGEALIAWRPDLGWEPLVPASDPRRALLELYLPVCSASAARPITVGHLGQSLDGFIATHSGDSQWVTGQENVLHLHRLRALCDAVIVGAGTVAADDPQLTTRRVAGPSPTRVIFDPARGLGGDYGVFTDDSVPTLYVCARALIAPGETHLGGAAIVGVSGSSAGADAAELLQYLHMQGCNRILVEGGGVTVSAFFEANLLDRLQIAVAPLIIGDGRPAIRLPARSTLHDCRRPRYRVFRMGGDVLFDCDLAAGDDGITGESDQAPVVRVI
jgi:riboflavin-specific deaminase-like protein